MSTDGISLNILEDATSDKLTKGDLRKAWARFERRWNPKTKEDKVEGYTKFLNYKLENTRQKPMDWLAFMEKKHTELMITGHRMDDETFIMHLLSSLPQSEYVGAILIIKDKLRNGYVGLPEIEQILEDKYQAMTNAKGWDEEDNDYALFARPSNKKKPKKVESLDIKQLIVPIRKATKIWVRKPKNEHKKKQSTKGDSKGKGHRDLSKPECYNCGEYGQFTQDCPKAHDHANIAQESEQNNKVENMLDFDGTSVCKECVMMCTELQYEDADEDQVVYRG